MSLRHKGLGYALPLRNAGRGQRRIRAAWDAYYQQRVQAAPNPLLAQTLDLFAVDGGGLQPRLALDLGCGAGQDTRTLLAQGWRVWALDARAQALQYGLADVPAEWAARLTVQLASFEAVAYGQCALPPADLIWASYSLPFCPPQAFAALWRTGCAALRPGGRWAGHLFGERDSWAATHPHLTFHTLTAAQHLLRDLTVEFWEERAAPGQTATGAPKFWHVFTFIARQK